MTVHHTDRGDRAPGQPSDISGLGRQTFDQIYHHPVSKQLSWDDVVSLVKSLGSVEERSNNEFVFAIGGESHRAHKPHTRHLTAPEILDLRHWMARAGYAPEGGHET